MVGVIYNADFSGEGEGSPLAGIQAVCGIEQDENGRGGGRMRRRVALVIGGSMSGLLGRADAARARLGGRSSSNGSRAKLSGRGAGIVAQAQLIAILKALRLDTRATSASVLFETRQILDPAWAA